MKKTIKVLIIGAAMSMFTTMSFANLRLFSPSVVNQAGAAGYDAQLDTWDYINTPALYPELSRDAFSLGYYGNNNLGIGLRSEIGLPLYLAVQVRQNAPVITDTVDTNSANTVNKENFNEANDNEYNVQIGSAFGSLGIGFFASLKNTGQSGTFTNNLALGATEKSAEWEFSDPSAPDKFGVNLGYSDSGTVVALGAAYLMAPGSNFKSTSADGTQSIEVINGSDWSHASNGVDFGAGIENNLLLGINDILSAAPYAMSAYALGITNMNEAPVYLPEKAANHYNGLEVQTFGWLPVGGSTFGWIVNYRASTMLANDPIEVMVKNGAVDDYTVTSTNEISGLGHIMANLYYTIIKEFAGGSLAISPDVTVVMDGYTVKNTIEFDGTIAGGLVPTATLNAGLPTTEITDDAMAVTLSLPLILKTEVSKNFDWIVGGNIGYTFASHTRKTVITDAAGNTTTTEDNSADSETGTGISGIATTGFQYRAADNLNVNAAISTATDGSNPIFTNAGVSVQYFLGGAPAKAAPAEPAAE
ncbi:MAG: hypothetical protein OEZ13_13390 [Spirochaetia bacterium]|nr:hypothetical protein [Spirochaetia bacterium]